MAYLYSPGGAHLHAAVELTPWKTRLRVLQKMEAAAQA